MTLDALYTDTGLCFHTGSRDVFYLNGILQDRGETDKISNFIDYFRQRTGRKDRVFISTYNNFPTAAGLASSASGYAALAGIANQVFACNLKDRDLSIITRRGSGSACRSLFGGFVTWQTGDQDQDSYAQEFAPAHDYAMLIVVVNKARKKYSSRQAMKAVVDQSIFYPAWVDQAKLDYEDMKRAILQQDFSKIGQIAEANCLRMHATTWGLARPFSYLQAESLVAMDRVRDLRAGGLEVYFTMDAGPNVKLFCQKKDMANLIAAMGQYYEPDQLIPAYAGSGYEIRECEHFGQG